MKAKYKELSLIGKVWALAELYNTGVGCDKKSYVEAAIRKLEALDADEKYLSSLATQEKSISNILSFITRETEEFVDDGSLVSSLWYNRAWLDDVKTRIRNNKIEDSDMAVLQDIYIEFKRFCVKDLKEKQLSSKERRELFEIKGELNNLIVNLNNRIKHSQIQIV